VENPTKTTACFIGIFNLTLRLILFGRLIHLIFSVYRSTPMNPILFLRGLLIGFSIAAPVGPIGVLCIRRTLAEGRMAGFISGLGAATADALYGSIAGFGLTIVSSFLISQGYWLQLAGGIFLLYLGIKTFLAKPKGTIETGSPLEKGRGIIGNYASTFFLTLTNPLTILSFIAIFAGLGLGTNTSADFLSAIVLVVGVFSGSAAWWFLLSSFTGLIRGKINRRILVWVNRVSAMIIIGFGLIALVSLV